MTRMKVLTELVVLVLTALCLAASPAIAAAPFDGSVSLLCAAAEIMECSDGQCARQSVEAVNLPRFIVVNFKEKTLTAADSTKRVTPIQRVEQASGRMILQGGQEGRAWSVTIAGDTGKLSAGVLVDEDTAVLVFGACTAR